MNWIFFRMLERKAVEILLRSPTFHRGVQNVHKKMHELQHGKAPDHYGGTNLENPGSKSDFKKLADLFWDELKTGHRSDTTPKSKK